MYYLFYSCAMVDPAMKFFYNVTVSVLNIITQAMLTDGDRLKCVKKCEQPEIYSYSIAMFSELLYT